MFAADTTTITVPSWIARIALPEYPAMPILGYLMLGMGALLLLIGYFAPIKKIPSLLTAMSLLAYYPLAFLLYWLLFRYDEQNRALRERTKFELFLFEHTHAFEWVILGVCAFFGFLFFVWTVWTTVRKWRRTRLRETADEDKPVAQRPPAPRPATPVPPAPRPATPRSTSSPQVPQARKVPKKPPTSPSENPFDFT
jgi:hypothetical protein